MGVTVQMKINIKPTQKAFDAYKRTLEPNLNKALDKSANNIWRKSKEMSPVDTNTLRGSISINKSRREFKRAVGSSVKYAVFVHEGTRPHFPPIKALEGWARRHKISPFVVARSIARKGTKAVPFLEKPLNESFKDIVGFIEEALEKSNIQTVQKIK